MTVSGYSRRRVLLHWLSAEVAAHIGAVILYEACNHRVLRRMSLRLCGKPASERLE